MKAYKYFSVIMMLLVLSLSFGSCSKDSDEEDEEGLENGSTQSSYTYSLMIGYWVNAEQWNLCKKVIKNSAASGTTGSNAYLDDPILKDGVEGYYVSKDGYAYELWITTTTTKYSNNSVAGNTVLKSWSCIDGKTVYFMNVSGSAYRHECCVSGNKNLQVGSSYFPILSTTAITGPGNVRYEKVTLSL